MSDFLLEIYSEEIPARMQDRAAKNMNEFTHEILTKENISIKKSQIQTLISPRRICLLINNIEEKQKIAASKIVGPKTSAPDKAIEGFLRANNLKDVSELEEIDHNKAKYYCYFKKESEISTVKIITESIDKIINRMTNSWPKLMRYQSQETGQTYKWIRPVRNILCLFDDKTVKIELFGLKSSNKTYGHFLNSNKQISINEVDQYQRTLEENFVIVDQNKRRELIRDQIKTLSKKHNLSTVDDERGDIFNEINGICEFPTALIGQIDNKFMDLPHEILILTLKSNQKFLCLKNHSGKLSQNFIFVTDSPSVKTNSDKIINDNQKVAYARLQDASFYVEEDFKKPLEEHYHELENLTFHEKLGNYKIKTKRVEILAEFLSLWVPHCPIALINETSKFFKSDLTMKTVAEFTSLQGNIGAYCAQKQGYPEEIVEAIYEHYLPTGSNADLPKTPLGIAMSIADKTDNIVGFFLSGNKPTSSKDPFGLRRSAIGILRICIEYNIQVPFRALVGRSLKVYQPALIKELLNESEEDEKTSIKKKHLVEDVVKFFVEKLKNILREDFKYNTDVINTIIDDYITNFDDHKYCDIIKLINRIKFVNDLVSDKENLPLIEIYKRTVNVLSIEEKKDKTTYDSKPHMLSLKQPEEKELYRAIKGIAPEFKKLVDKGEFKEAFEKLKLLYHPLSQFFDNVLVNDENQKIRHNRLLLLSTIRRLFSMVADLSNVEIQTN